MKAQHKSLASRVSRFASFTALAAALGLAVLPARADTEACTNCITFSADKAFGVCLIRGTAATHEGNLAPAVNKLEWSTDRKNWSEYKQILET